MCLNTCKLERENGSFLITHHMPKPLFSMLKKVFIKDKCSTDLERISADKVLSAQYRTGDKEYVTLFSVMLKIFSIPSRSAELEEQHGNEKQSIGRTGYRNKDPVGQNLSCASYWKKSCP